MTETTRPVTRVAIVMLSAVGDVVHVLPVVNSLRAGLPGVHITWIVQPGPASLVRDHPAVDELILFDRRRGWRAFRDVYRATRGRRFDLVLGLQVYFKAGLIVGMLNAPRKLGFDRARAKDANWLFTNERIPARPRGHTQDEYLEFVRHLGLPVRLEWGLGSTAEERRRYAGLLPPDPRPTVAMVVGTSKPEKEWPAERYAELADRLYAMGLRSVLAGGRSAREDQAAEVIRGRASHPPLDLREMDLRRLVYLIERSDVLVSPDTGPLHIGVALGTPSVALMGYTNPGRFGPYARFSDLLVDAFGDPGEEYTAAAGHRPGRMRRITVDQVLERVERALRRYPRSEEASGQSSP